MSRLRRPVAVMVAAAAGAALLAGCASGIAAETSREHAAIQGIDTAVGPIVLRDVYLEPAPGAGSPGPSGTASGSPSATPLGPTGAAAGASQSATATPTADAPHSAYLVMVMVNNGTGPDTLTGVATPNGGSVSVRPASASLTLNPNRPVAFVDPTTDVTGMTAVVTGLPDPAVVGTSVPVTVTFASAGSLTFDVPVVVNNGTEQTSTPVPGSSS